MNPGFSSTSQPSIILAGKLRAALLLLTFGFAFTVQADPAAFVAFKAESGTLGAEQHGRSNRADEHHDHFQRRRQQPGPHSMIKHDAPNSPESKLKGAPIREKRELARTAIPLTHIDQQDPPFLILHGDNDQLVPLGQSVVLARGRLTPGWKSR
jgi:hypothetical protein